jgi:uncharacterized MnhB-related membrane protein
MSITTILLILLIIVSVAIIVCKDNLRIVILFSAFSLVTASLYYFYHSPDLALAEVAIGSAIMPLVFIISISKQKEFLVISHIEAEDDFLNQDFGKGYKLLEEFTKHYGLKLVISKSDYDQLKGVFRKRNVDLVVERCTKTGIYIFKGKSTSILMNRLEQITKPDKSIKVLMIKEGETDD